MPPFTSSSSSSIVLALASSSLALNIVPKKKKKRLKKEVELSPPIHSSTHLSLINIELSPIQEIPENN